MIRIAIVDDEKIILEKICQLIERSIDIKTSIDIFESSNLFFQKVNNILCDIVFLDIDMPEINGFEIAKTLNNARPDITIIFVSNFEHLVFESFEFHPFRFVRKSCLEKDIECALASYKKEIKRKQDIYFFKTNEAERSVRIADIMYFESIGHDIFTYVSNQKATDVMCNPTIQHSRSWMGCYFFAQKNQSPLNPSEPYWNLLYTPKSYWLNYKK